MMFYFYSKNLVTFCFAVFTFSISLNAVADPAIWKISGEKNTVYLFGSVHVANQSMYPLGKQIESAFNESEVLAVEVDEARVDQVQLQQLMMSRGFYSGTESIKDHVSAATFDLLQKVLAGAGVPYVTVARMKPGIIALTLTVAKIMQLGYSPELGIDRHFMKLARGKKEIQQLETTEQQMNLLLSFSDDDLLLRQTLQSVDKMESMITDLVRSWKNGDTAQMEKLLLTDQIEEFPEFQKVLEALIDDRNVAMAVKIQHMLNDNKDYFVVVGAGHLVGDKGIVSLLKKNKLPVSRL